MTMATESGSEVISAWICKTIVALIGSNQMSEPPLHGAANHIYQSLCNVYSLSSKSKDGCQLRLGKNSDKRRLTVVHKRIAQPAHGR